VAYFVLLASSFLLLSVATALRPGRRGILQVLAFPVGWAAGELPVQAIITQAAFAGLLWWWGWPRTGWLSDTVVAVAIAVIIANLILVLVLLSSQHVVARAMARAKNEPLTIDRPGHDAFGSWWRTLLQVPWHPKSMIISSYVPYGPKKRQRLDIWRLSTTPSNAPVIFYVHGGAWTFGDKSEQGRPLLHEMVSRGWIAVAINYHLAPKNPWPAQIEDVTRAFGWVKSTIGAMGGDPSRIVVAGASAGGHLAALLALSSNDASWRPAEMAHVADWSVRGCISYYGVLEMTGDENVWDAHGEGLRELLERYVVGVSIRDNPQLYRSMSPYERITDDAPAFLVIQGGNDTLVDVNVARHFVTRFEQIARAPIYYVEIPLTQHAFDVTASPRTSAVTRAAVAFAQSVIR
jgi:acetyl esterase/lipase